MIRELQTIAYLSAIANVLCLIGLIGTYQYLFFHLKNPNDFPPFAPAREFPLFFGIAVFAYEGIGIVSSWIFFFSLLSLKFFLFNY